MDISNIYDAKEVLKDVISKTPLVHADKLHENLWIKAENLQGTGAFKLRGAYHKLHSLTQKEREKGVIAASAGNHAQGVAYSCMKMGIKGTIVMPKTAPLSKIEATRSYGVAVELQGDTFNDAYEYAKNLQEITGAVFVEPFDDEYVIAGQGTIGLEILDKLSDVDTVIVPIGGGGLISGIAVAIKAMRPSCRIIGVQSEHAPSMKQSLEKKEIIKLQNVSTIADGIAVMNPGKITVKLIQENVDEMVSVSDSEIAATILLLLEREKQVVEPAGAASLAAVLNGKINVAGKRVVCVLSGGNIDVSFIHKVVEKGLVSRGRNMKFKTLMLDVPGALEHFTHILCEQNANIIEIQYDRIQADLNLNETILHLAVEVSSKEHGEALIKVLKEKGYEITME